MKHKKIEVQQHVRDDSETLITKKPEKELERKKVKLSQVLGTETKKGDICFGSQKRKGSVRSVVKSWKR